MKILVVIIHHGVPERVKAAREAAGVVSSALSTFGEVSVAEVFQQPDPWSIPASTLVRRLVHQWQLERRWADYLCVRPRWLLSSCLLILRVVSLAMPSRRKTARRRTFIEQALTVKHQRAWRMASESQVDLLVVLEDDARAHSASTDRIQTLIQIALDDGRLPDAFVDLAGGLSFRSLRLGAWENAHGEGVVTLSRPATNTLCGYAVGRRVLDALVTAREEDARLSPPADWFMNRAFMDWHDDPQAPEVLCIHSRPHALIHGSFSGQVASSIR